MRTLYRTKGSVQGLTVTKKGGMITLWSEQGIRHTVFDPAAPHLPGLEYARNMLAVLAFCPRAQSCLVLGLGGGSIPRMLLAASPQMEVEAVEIDTAVMALAEEYFHIRALPRLTIHLKDAAEFLRRCTSRYGIIVVDTYIGEKLPDQCITREFIRNARRCLLDDGVLAINWLSGDTQKRLELRKNLESIVGPVWQLCGQTSRNLLYFSMIRKIARPEIVSAATLLGYAIPFENSLKRIAERLRELS